MANQKFDGVVEAVHYQSDGQIAWVRMYLRRGPTFSDYILLKRQTLIEHLKAGKKYVIGERVLQLSSTFKVSQPIRVIQKDSKDILVVGGGQSTQEHLDGVPVI